MQAIQHHSMGSQPVSEKGPGSNDCRASLGNGRAELSARRIKGRQNMARRARNSTGTFVLAPTNILPNNERDAAKEFSAVVIPFSLGELAQAGKRTKDAAKKWKDGSALPSAWTMLNLAREIPAVRSYMMAKLGGGAHMQFNSAQGIDALANAVQVLSQVPGPDGDAIRAILAGVRVKL